MQQNKILTIKIDDLHFQTVENGEDPAPLYLYLNDKIHHLEK